MIVIYRLDKPSKIFAFHDDYQESEVVQKYPGSFFGCKKGPYKNLNVDDLVPSEYTPITLNVDLVIDNASKESLGII